MLADPIGSTSTQVIQRCQLQVDHSSMETILPPKSAASPTQMRWRMALVAFVLLGVFGTIAAAHEDEPDYGIQKADKSDSKQLISECETKAVAFMPGLSDFSLERENPAVLAVISGSALSSTGSHYIECFPGYGDAPDTYYVADLSVDGIFPPI